MPFDYIAAAALLDVPSRAVPFIRGWNRLEGRPRTFDFERALRAEVRDALWFLTRQWQFGEFQGEDAASPVEVRTIVQAAQLISYAPRGAQAVAYDRAMPLETRVEAEAVPADLTLHLQVTRAFFGLLAGQPRLAVIRPLYLDPATYGLAETAVVGALDEDARQVLSIAAGRTLDGARLVQACLDGSHQSQVAGFSGLTGIERDALRDAGSDLITWYRRLYHAPIGGSAWASRFIEYQFNCTAERPGAADVTLVADQYEGGRLDWYAFDAAPSDAVPFAAPEPPPVHSGPALSFIPAPVSFAGMPSPRYWEMESRKTDFAAIDAGTTDLARLLLTEFALVYGNDWCLIPYVVEVGSICEIPGLLVVDNFGETTLVRAAGRGRDEAWQRWSMFTLSSAEGEGTADLRLFVPPALTASMVGQDIEQVLLLRDEMANMVWGVEKVVPAALGGGVDGYAVAREDASPSSPPLHPTVARTRYVLGTDVPRNWHPFLPVRVAGTSRSVQLQRARMPGPARAIRGAILAGPSPYYLNEEEVPRAGKSVTRAFERARWLDGRSCLWVGRRVKTGRGEGSSGLAFDQIVDAKDGS